MQELLMFIDQADERTIQVRGHVGVQVVVVGTVPLHRGIDVLHYHPNAVAACIIGAAGQALLHDNKIFGRAVDLDLDDAANGLCAQFYVCHCYLLVFVQANGMISAGRVFCDTERDRALCCFL